MVGNNESIVPVAGLLKLRGEEPLHHVAVELAHKTKARACTDDRISLTFETRWIGIDIKHSDYFS